jgi:hypothetical protein
MNEDLKNDLNDALRHSREAARSMMKAVRDALDVAINALDRDGTDEAEGRDVDAEEPARSGDGVPPSQA